MSAATMTGVVKRFGSTVAVSGIDLEVESGDLLGLIGPNGAGKSTMLAMLATLIRPTAGTIRVLGHDVVGDARQVRRRVGFMPDRIGFYDDMTVEEHLMFFARAHEIGRRERHALVDNLLELVELGPLRHRRVASLSRGQSQRLGVGRVLVHDPEVLLLDEPASGLDPAARTELLDLLAQLRDLGKTIVISTHILSEIEPLCTSVAVMAAGRIVALGRPDELRTTDDPTRTIRVRFADGDGPRTADYTVIDDAGQEALLRRLVVDEGRAVLDFHRIDGGLAALFSPTAFSPSAAADDPEARS